jgi:FkbM family methyltransferase
MLIDLISLNKSINLNVDNIAHIGANLGQEVSTYNELFPYSHVYLIEPQKLLFEELEKKFKNNSKITLINKALGNTTGKVKLNSSSTNKSAASILEPYLHKDIHPEVIFEGSEVVSIDKYKNLNLKNVNFLNMDTQGFELEILRGLEEEIKNIRYIQTEINNVPLYKNMPLLKDIDKFLNNAGFIRLITVFWNEDCYWGDAFYIRKVDTKLRTRVRCIIKNKLFKYKIFYRTTIKVRKLWK